MESSSKNTYFTNEALARFVAAQGRTVEKVVCHLWQNTHNPSEPVEIIDNVEFHFADKTKLTISCNQDGDALDAIDFDYLKAAKALHLEFEGKIKLFSVNASQTKMWEDVIGKTLNLVKLTKDGEYYKANALVLDFGEEKREIEIAPLDGLIIDFYEE
ncbi:MAG: hypothetical protein SFY56_15375 [Bacteroidota bacterium]|nr:hypothetical protein [Bacteroidota bacterium]